MQFRPFSVFPMLFGPPHATHSTNNSNCWCHGTNVCYRQVQCHQKRSCCGPWGKTATSGGQNAPPIRCSRRYSDLPTPPTVRTTLTTGVTVPAFVIDKCSGAVSPEAQLLWPLLQSSDVGGTECTSISVFPTLFRPPHAAHITTLTFVLVPQFPF